MVTSLFTSFDYLYYFGIHVNIILPEVYPVAILLPSEFKNYENKWTYLQNRNILTD